MGNIDKNISEGWKGVEGHVNEGTGSESQGQEPWEEGSKKGIYCQSLFWPIFVWE